MAFKRLESMSLTDMFVDEIKRMILTGELEVGEKLPPERQMAEEMHVSLAVVNAGITRLSSIKLLRAEPRKGIFVEDYLQNGDLNTMMAILNFPSFSLDQDVLGLFEVFRRSIEIMIMKRACENRSDADLAKLASLVRRARDRTEYENASEIVFEFRHEAAYCSGNPYFAMVMQTFKPAYIFFSKCAFADNCWTQDMMADELAEIYDLIQRKDAASMEKRLNIIIDEWVQSFMQSRKFRRA